MTAAQPDELPNIDARILDWGIGYTVVRSYLGEPEPPRNRSFTTVHELVVKVAGTTRVVSGFPIYMGSGHAGQPPSLRDTMEMYASDARDGAKTFDEFLSDFVTDAEPSVVRSYRDVHRKCRAIRRAMLSVFGTRRLDLLMYETDYS